MLYKFNYGGYLNIKQQDPDDRVLLQLILIMSKLMGEGNALALDHNGKRNR